jgi:hypothetical protein
MNGYYSTWNSINARVPQGSILGPLLFLLFTNDIVDVVSNSMKLFADDTSLYCIVDDQNETAESLNSYCTDSIKSDCSLVQLSQTTLPYSSIGLIKPK